MSLRFARRIAGPIVGVLALFAFFSSSAIASGPPVVSINSTTEHSLNTALASGTVDKNGASSVSYKFEYGKSKLYGQSTKEFSTATSGSVPISEILTGLESNSTYHVRVSATNSFGTTTSGDVQFEMSLGWKVEGKKLSEFPKGVSYEWTNNPEPFPTLKITGMVVGFSTEILCHPSKTESLWANEILGSYHPMAWDECKVYANGEQRTTCVVKPFTLNLGSTLVAEAASTKLELGEKCSLVENLQLGRPGFALAAMPEAKQQVINMTAKAGIQLTLTATISNFKWVLTKEQVGKTFGIS